MAAPPITEPPLLDGEQVLWRSMANWRRAERPRHPILGAMATLALALAFTIGAVFVLSRTDGQPPDSLPSAALTLVLIIALTAVVVTWAKFIGQIFNLAKPRRRRDPAVYLLTTMRLIAHRGPAFETHSIMRIYPLLAARLERNGHVHDLELWFGPDSMVEYWDLQERMVLHALEDGEDAKRRILESFRAPAPPHDAPSPSAKEGP